MDKPESQGLTTPAPNIHTSGPWTVNPLLPDRFDIVGPDGKWIAETEDSLADACLIAAAPELLAALKELLEHAEEFLAFGTIGGRESEIRCRVYDLISKVQGEPSPQCALNDSLVGKE